jgi:hypothetical protein
LRPKNTRYYVYIIKENLRYYASFGHYRESTLFSPKARTWTFQYIKFFPTSCNKVTCCEGLISKANTSTNDQNYPAQASDHHHSLQFMFLFTLYSGLVATFVKFGTFFTDMNFIGKQRRFL